MRSNGEEFTYLLVGVGLGVVIGMLLAPRSGEEAREYLRERALEGGEYLKQQTGRLRDTGTELLERSKEFAGKA